MRDPSRVPVTGPLAPYAGGFRSELAELGYTPSSAAKQLNLMGAPEPVAGGNPADR
jgi:integrase/recombinase XerD